MDEQRAKQIAAALTRPGEQLRNERAERRLPRFFNVPALQGFTSVEKLAIVEMARGNLVRSHTYRAAVLAWAVAVGGLGWALSPVPVWAWGSLPLLGTLGTMQIHRALTRAGIARAANELRGNT